MIEKLMASDEAMATDAPVRKRGRKPAVMSKANGKAKVAKANGKAAKAPKAPVKAKRQRDLTNADTFGYTKDCLKSKACIMYSNKKTKGATLAEVREALDSTQFNVLPEVEKRGWKVTRTKEPGEGNRKVTRYQIIL